jgi:hypothetical protein
MPAIFMCRLRFFKVYINLGSINLDNLAIFSFLIGSRALFISLTSPATLELLRFKIRFRRRLLSFEHTFYENPRRADVWKHLDSITSHPTGSRLRRVDISIEYTLHFHDYEDRFDNLKDELEKSVLDCSSLPSLCSKGILFVEPLHSPYPFSTSIYGHEADGQW